MLQVCEISHPEALFLRLVKEPEIPHKVPSIKDLHNKYLAQAANNVSFEEFIWQETTETDRKHLGSLQQSDAEWMGARLGRITASVADSLFHARSLMPAPKSLLARIMGETGHASSAAISYGTAHEPIAREIFCMQEEPQHVCMEVQQCGLILAENPIIRTMTRIGCTQTCNIEGAQVQVITVRLYSTFNMYMYLPEVNLIIQFPLLGFHGELY